MGQYGRHFYGSTYYGTTSVYTGVYTTPDINTDEVLNGLVDVQTYAELPSLFYGFSDFTHYTLDGVWEDNSDHKETYDTTALFRTRMTMDEVKIRHIPHSFGATVHVHVETLTMQGSTVENNFEIDTSNLENESDYLLEGLPFGDHTISITLDPLTESHQSFRFQGIKGRVCHILLETRASLDRTNWTPYEQLQSQITHVEGDSYIVESASPNYDGNNKFQIKYTLAAADNTRVPKINRIQMTAGDTSNRTEDGMWQATIDMQLLAESQTQTYNKVVGFEWQEEQPGNTKMDLRSTSSGDGVDFHPLTVPYRKDRNRFRIKRLEGGRYATFATITSPLINPKTNPNLRIDSWIKWRDESYLPPQENGTSILYRFLNPDGQEIYRIDDPSSKQEGARSLENANLGSQTFRVQMEITTRQGREVPVVDKIDLTSDLIYEEPVQITDKDFSAVDNDNTGEDIIINGSDIAFNPPQEATSIVYTLEDQLERPNDVFMYLNSEKDSTEKEHRTHNLQEDAIWAKIYVENEGYPSSSVPKHFQYGGGSVSFHQPQRFEIAPSFTPQLSQDHEYRYYLSSMWPDQIHFSREGDTLESIALMYDGTDKTSLESANSDLIYESGNVLLSGQRILIPNDSFNPKVAIYWQSEESALDRTYITGESIHNANYREENGENDKVVAEISDVTDQEQVAWTSEEKIYRGFFNRNNQFMEYIREHEVTEEETVPFEYEVQSGDTFRSIARRFSIDEEDLRYQNQHYDESFNTGDMLLVPARISLPRIEPWVTVGEEPYNLEVIYNSLRKQDGTRIDEDWIDTMKLEFIEEEVLVEHEKVIRQGVTNGRDLLNNAKITEIVNVWDELDGGPPSYTSDTYMLVDNFIDWSPTPNGSFQEPELGETYYVSYKCMKPVRVKVIMSSDYREESGVDRLWRSNYIKKIEGVCRPGKDFKAILPDFSQWQDTNSSGAIDLRYIVEDDDLWVKTHIDYSQGSPYLIGSLQDRIPSDHWHPQIKTGYYYLGDKEYYLFSTPVTITPTNKEMILAENVTYVDGKYDGGIHLHKASENIIRNSSFQSSSTMKTVYHTDFSEGIISEGVFITNLGITEWEDNNE